MLLFIMFICYSVIVCIGTYIIKSAKNYSKQLPDNDYRKQRQVLNEDLFCHAMQQIVIDSTHQSYFEHMSEYIDRICNLAYKHNVKLDAEHFHVFMALKVAEGSMYTDI